MPRSEPLAAEFKRRVIAVVMELGGAAEGNPHVPDAMMIPTLAGPLRVEPMTRHSLWIACRFEDVRAAVDALGSAPIVGVNPSSGKWNHVFDHDSAVEANVATFRDRLAQLQLGAASGGPERHLARIRAREAGEQGTGEPIAPPG